MGRQSVGLVALHTTGIEKKGLTFGDRPAVSEHWNNINVCQLRGRPVSYDVNGIVHFWLE